MSTHINAPAGSIADTVLLPGDPLRAQYMAENFLTDVVRYNEVRAAYGYTGVYRGQKVSIQATGMGMPSIAIYSTELMRDYGVQRLIRTGTCGGLAEEVHLRDIVLAQAATTDSSMIVNTFGPGVSFAPTGDFNLLRKAATIAETSKLSFHVGNVLGEDQFYNDNLDRGKLTDYGVLATEMEVPALYLLAAKYRRQALGIMTVSDHLVRDEHLSAEERQLTLNQMIELALQTAIS
ncbi:purine-nucleoside phosphorylase [Lacticaseibacillus sharpeae]|uniref:Purine nucleoside phosphorylase DeoD-type n=1 Tax=Lacticaseibacillus sharpeae JCM 1186 = DSM 20505 TaxID=1291052 RepID=A0A0R1ZK36_9LACO|nr:purine-nucleoside phosphorylase [Lacticaseibacillus sharpeae]KRM55313.1 purine nucleoside phosphorylase [Lacticaseibacillus sharpeae JCM 1186 = DSM 20505]